MAADLHPQKKRRVSRCVGCGAQIHDQYILRVSPDLEWHAACLKCADCHQFLDETCTCFVRDGKTYCKRDYVRLFGAKCAKCNMPFSKSDFVMRAKSKIYHMDCFRCLTCTRQLLPGDEFALREDGLFCKADCEVLLSSLGEGKPQITNGDSSSPGLTSPTLQMAASAEPMQPTGRTPSMRSSVHKQSSGASGDHKPTRVRTVLNEKQLHTLRTCYAANPRPDALMKEQLVEMTGLSPRVIRVWFQNKRCKDKKRSIMLKQMQQQEKHRQYLIQLGESDSSPPHSPDGRQLTLGSMRGVPMVATSPVRHESPIQMNPIEVQTYQPPWKSLADYALHADHLDPSQPHFQQLVSQMHGYGSDPTDPHGSNPLPPYLSGAEDPLHQPPSNLSSSHVPGTPSELSSPGSE